MSILEFAILIGAFILMMALYRNADRYIKRLKPETVKTVNWIGFGVAALAGIGWYFYPHIILMALTLGGVIVYFLFYGYDAMEEKGK